MEYVIKNQPLVSIIIVTFNSQKHVIETLESCKNQTYHNLELIITDDCSTDNTADICNQWINENKERFVRAEIVTTFQNTGISSNCNRGAQAANGDWLKFIAGDDALLPNCILDNVDFIINNSAAQIICSKRLDFKDVFKEENFIGEYPLANHPFRIPQINASKQFEVLLRKCCVSAPTVFMKKSLLLEVKGFDERVPMVEDWPLWIKITSAGYKIFFLNKATVKYRVHGLSASSSQSQELFTKHNLRMASVHKYYIYPYLPYFERFMYDYNFKRMKLFNALGINRNTRILSILSKFTAYPVAQYRRLKYKKLIKTIR